MGSLVESMAHFFVKRLMRREFAVLQNPHDDCSTAMCTGVLSKIVRARELLTTLIAFKRLVLRVERAIVTLEVLLTAEAARAKSADKSLGRVFGQRLLAATTVGWGVLCLRSICIAGDVIIISGAWLTLGCSGRSVLAIRVGVDVSVGLTKMLELKIAVRRAGALHLALSLLLAGTARSRVGEGRSRRGREARVSGVVVVIKATKAVDTEEVLLLTDGQLLSLVAVVGNIGVSEVHEAELVFRVKFGAEGGLEGGVLDKSKGISCVMLRGDREGCVAQSKLVLVVFASQGGQRREALDRGRQNRLKRGRRQFSQVDKLSDGVGRGRDLRLG